MSESEVAPEVVDPEPLYEQLGGPLVESVGPDDQPGRCGEEGDRKAARMIAIAPGAEQCGQSHGYAAHYAGGNQSLGHEADSHACAQRKTRQSRAGPAECEPIVRQRESRSEERRVGKE